MFQPRRAFALLSALLLLFSVACGGGADDETDQEPIQFEEDTGFTDTLMCSAPERNCSGQCVNVQENGEHCGKCGNACPEGGFWCNGGKCECLSQGATNCDGKCVELDTDENNCGKCGKTCGAGQKCDNKQCVDLSFVEKLIKETNAARAEGQDCEAGHYPPAPPVTGNAELHEAAQKHARQMARKDFFAHEDPYDNSNPKSRVNATDYSGRYSGENIAAGNKSAQKTVQQWLDSKTGHCKNLMNAGHDEMGVGYTQGKPVSKYPHYWVQVFGKANNNQ